MSWRDTITDEAPAAAAPTDAPAADAPGPLKVTIPTAENLANAQNKPAASWRDTIKDDDNAPNPFVQTFKQGASDAGDLLGDTGKFLTGQELSKQETPAFDEAKKKIAAGTADRHDYERVFLEGMSNSPGGKLLGAVGGMLPSLNVATTTLNKWINPYISDKTGIDPAELQLGEMAAPFVGKAGYETAKNPGLLKDFVTDEHGGSGSATRDKPYIPSFKMSDLPEVKLAGMMGRAALPLASSGIKGAVGVLKSAASPVTNAIVDTDNPLGGQGLANALKSDTAQEGTRLENNIPGLKFSAGELTGNSRARGIEDTLANSAKWSDQFAQANSSKINAITDKFGAVLDSLHDKETVPDDFGGRLSSAYRSTLDSLKQTRREQAKVDFDTAYQGADDAGKYIQSNNLFRTLQELREEGDARLLTDSKALGGKMARNLLSKLAVKTQKGNEMADTITIKELGNGLSDFGEDAANQDHSDATRRVYTRLYSALQNDLDAEIANPKGDPQRIGMLAVARDNYKNISDRISDIQKTTLGNIVGYADHNSQGQLVLSPEGIANKFNSLQPSELKTTLKFLDDNHPDVANMGRRYMLESAFNKAQEGIGGRGVGTSMPFPKAKFVEALPTPAKLNVLLGDGRAYDNIMDIYKATNRLIDWGASQGNSKTFQRGNVFQALYGLGKGALIKSIVSDNLAQDLLDPSKRNRMGVEARQSSKIFDNLKTGTKNLYSDQSGAMTMDFAKAKQRLMELGKIPSANENMNIADALKSQGDWEATDDYQTNTPIEKLQAFRNGLQDKNPTNTTYTPMESGRTAAQKLEWLRNNLHPSDLMQLQKENGPINKWPEQDIHDFHDAAQ